MSTANTRFPLVAVNYGTPWLSVRLPESLVSTVSRHLDAEGIWHRLDDHIITLDGKPPMTNIWFKRGADLIATQASLDRLPPLDLD